MRCIFTLSLYIFSTAHDGSPMIRGQTHSLRGWNGRYISKGLWFFFCWQRGLCEQRTVCLVGTFTKVCRGHWRAGVRRGRKHYDLRFGISCVVYGLIIPRCLGRLASFTFCCCSLRIRYHFHQTHGVFCVVLSGSGAGAARMLLFFESPRGQSPAAEPRRAPREQAGQRAGASLGCRPRLRGACASSFGGLRLPNRLNGTAGRRERAHHPTLLVPRGGR